MPDTQLIELAKVDDVPTDRGLRVKQGSTYIALFKKDDTIHAIDAICPHAGAFLDEGYFDGDIVMCPLHGWDFEVATGKSPCYGIETRCFEVTVKDGAIFWQPPAESGTAAE